MAEQESITTSVGNSDAPATTRAAVNRQPGFTETPAIAFGPTTWIRLIESTGFIAFMTAVIYFIGYSYYAGYFGRLSFPAPYPQLSTSDYLVRAFNNLASLSAVLLTLGSFKYVTRHPETRRQAIAVNIGFLTVALIMIANGLLLDFERRDVLWLVACIAVLAIVGIVFKFSIVNFLIWNEGLVGAAIGYGFFLLFVFVQYFQAMGSADAVRFVEGKTFRTFATVYTNDPKSEIDGVPLLIALDRGDRYYLVRQQQPAPADPLVYVIPESDITHLEIQKSSARATPVATK